MAKRKINSKLYQSHKEAIKSLRKYKREANFMNQKMNELVDEIIDALEADAFVERKTPKEYKCDLVVEEFLDLFFEEIKEISRIPFELVFVVYKGYCRNHSLFAYDEKKYFKYSMLEYIECRPECGWYFDEGQKRIIEKDKKQMPSVILGVRISNNLYRDLDRDRGFLVKVN